MAVNIVIQEVGGNVVWTATGTLNVAGLTKSSTQVGGVGFDAANAIFGSGIGASADVYSGSITKPASFGAGGAAATSGSGGYLSIQSIPATLWVPAGYTSGGAISNTTTYTGSFASLGLTPGTYVYSWGSGGNADTITLSIGESPTPTPTITQTQTNTPTPSSTPPPVVNTVVISSNNYSGQLADITFYPCSGGTTSLGEHVLPYTYESTYYYGQYSLYFSAYNSTCTYNIVCPSPTPTTTSTPTVTPTNTPTPTSAVTPTDGWFFYYTENTPVSTAPTNNGNTAFIPSGSPNGTYNPNYTGGTLSLYFNTNNSAGTSYSSQFSGLDTAGGTITMSQGSSTAIYSGAAGNYTVIGGYLQLQVTNSSQMIQSASTPFVSGTSINVVVS
jgi:hypothetical protein